MAICPQTFARPPQPRVQRGVIEMIDRDARILRIQRDGEAVPLTIVWNKLTRFVEGSRFVSAAELKKGTPVTIWYRTPFFGERFATKIVIERSAGDPSKHSAPQSINPRP